MQKPLSNAERQARYRKKYRQISFGAQLHIFEAVKSYQQKQNCSFAYAIEDLILEGHKALAITKK
jgi:hypothetical protein